MPEGVEPAAVRWRKDGDPDDVSDGDGRIPSCSPGGGTTSPSASAWPASTARRRAGRACPPTSSPRPTTSSSAKAIRSAPNRSADRTAGPAVRVAYLLVARRRRGHRHPRGHDARRLPAGPAAASPVFVTGREGRQRTRPGPSSSATAANGGRGSTAVNSWVAARWAGPHGPDSQLRQPA
ncbi:MAG: hypothetical protein MZV64_10690 [Ignavibacteriales bacterium]|nr:hypothetical protein [Ignavibacteriales bacterium]